MAKYGQYCPVAKALELIGDRWTLLIVRDMLFGTRHFNDLERGLPGISRALLSVRLRQMQHAGIIDKAVGAGRTSTAYRLTQAGTDLMNVISSLMVWGEAWAFGDPAPDELDPILLMWQMRTRVNVSQLPQPRVVAQFDFDGFDFRGENRVTFWLILTPGDATLCLTDPGYEIDLVVTANLASFFKLWARKISYRDALDVYGIAVDGMPGITRAFPALFGWQTNMPEPA